MWWSVVLAAVGVLGLYLTTRKMAAGYAVGVGVQVLWITYAVVTAQYGFIFSALAFGAVNALGFYRWTNEKPAPVFTPDIVPDEGEMKVRRSSPSVFNHMGDPKWDLYPFVEVWDDKVLIGPTSKRVILSNQESFQAGRALIEASRFIFEKQSKENSPK